MSFLVVFFKNIIRKVNSNKSIKSNSNKKKSEKDIPTQHTESDSDESFLKKAYREVLGREIDQEGLDSHLKLLQNGYTRTDILISLTKSEEFINKVLQENYSIQSIRELKPDKYQLVDDILNNNQILVFNAETQEDFDWLESMILEYGYYEKPGVWSFNINIDKRVMAEIMSFFQPQKALEIGCANGTVLQCLHDLNIYCEGIEISKRAIRQAFPDIKNNIHLGDILDIQLESKYDLIFGLDIFEHLNPNKLARYIDRIYHLLNDGGFLFCNIPAFGCDPIFGTVFPIYIKDWEIDSSQGNLFSKLHVDKDGYPINGHLIWADYQWWANQFEQKGFVREIETEKALHTKYDHYMGEVTPARKSYYVFSKNVNQSQNINIMNLLDSTASKVINQYNY